MKTCAAFIHEYDAYDDFEEACYEFDRELAVAEFELAKAYHAADMNIFFEGEEGDANAKKAAASDSFLAKIGKMIQSLIESIGKLIESFTGKIANIGKNVRTDKEKIEAILAKRPELAKDINVGLEKGWYTEKDVASFEKDTLGLLKLVEQGKMDHKTFHQKGQDLFKKLNESISEPAQACRNVKEILSVAPTVMDHCSKTQKHLNAAKKNMTDFNETLKKVKADPKHADDNFFQAAAEAHRWIAKARKEEADRATTAAEQIASIMAKISDTLDSKM